MPGIVGALDIDSDPCVHVLCFNLLGIFEQILAPEGHTTAARGAEMEVEDP